jgi:hypothetical protein
VLKNAQMQECKNAGMPEMTEMTEMTGMAIPHWCIPASLHSCIA